MMHSKPPDLNSAQWEAVVYSEGPLMIIAGPGTGKTHTLTHRIFHTLSRLKESQAVLAVTFTNKAAMEMRERLTLRLNAKPKNVFVGTFHAFCLDFLREFFQEAGLQESFRIASVLETEQVSKDLWAKKSAKERKAILEVISGEKRDQDRSQSSPDLVRFNKALREKGLLDFDDLIAETIGVLKKDPQILETVRRRYPFIFVDEYQDINHLQYALLRILAGASGELTAIGDPNQAIYGFRGSDVRYFENFQDDFPGARIVSLDDNYRSSKNLLAASGQVIGKAKLKFVPQLTANIYTEGRLTIHEASTDKAEAEYVVHQIERSVGGTSMFSQDSARVRSDARAQRSFGDIAVLYRLNAQKNSLKTALERSGIPYQISGDKPLLAQSGIREIMDLLRDEVKSPGSDDFKERLRRLIKSGQAGKIFKQIKSAQEHLWRLLGLADRFETYKEFCDYLYSQSSNDFLELKAEKVSLMTLHAAKGLEFPVVFIVGCEQNLIPLDIKGMRSDREEERRLFYVGMTRAQEQIYFVSAKKRYLYGQMYQNAPSVFLGDIAQDLKTIEKAASSPGRRKKDPFKQLDLFSGS